MKKTLLSAAIAAATLFSNPAISQTTFNYTGSSQIYVVPMNVTQIQVDVRGARGGDGVNPNGGNGIGGNGGQVTALLPVAPGETLTVYVGGMGQVGSPGGGMGGFNGGGNGEDQYQPGSWMGGGGGGASDIRQGGTALNNRVIVAGGGGGGGSNCNTPNGNAGGQGGGLNGGDALSCTGNGHGLGGTQLAGGQGGLYQWDCGSGGPASPGTLGVGGDADVCSAGGGGGGGYYGGGGGDFGGGGGGSNYAGSGASSVIHTQGQNPNDGIVIITPLAVGIPGLDDKLVSVSVYPVPAIHELHLDVAYAIGSLDARIASVTGSIMMMFAVDNPNKVLDVSALPSGVYFLFLNDQAGNRICRMFSKQ